MCIGLHTLPPCLLFCGNYILHESEYDVHIFCVALDIIIYPPPLRPHFQKTQRFIDRLKRRNYPPQQVVGKRHYQIYLFYAIKYLLPIVLFVGQHFSGSLFHLITLLLFTRETTKGTRARELGAPSPYPLGFLPRGSLFPYSHPHSAWGVGETRKTT